MLTLKQFKKIFPRSVDSDILILEMTKLFDKYGINTNKRIAAFISQCGHESGGWRVFTENLNYSENGLNSTFGKYFKHAGRSAKSYARHPEKIANLVYANRIGNGPEESGDGWKYRGRGPIQLTGKSNYQYFYAFISDYKIDIISNPNLLSDNYEIGLLSAIWFWNSHNLNNIADTGDIKLLTKKINGGYNGLEDRIIKYNKCLSALQNTTKFKLVKLGSTGELVIIIQQALGLIPDGQFGKNTMAAVKKWQKSNYLIVDGIVGKNTYRQLIR